MEITKIKEGIENITLDKCIRFHAIGLELGLDFSISMNEGRELYVEANA